MSSEMISLLIPLIVIILAGVTLSEYIRRRRLTLAAFELISSELK